MAKKPGTPDEAIKEIRKLLADWLDASDKASKPVAQIMRLLEVVEEGRRGRGARESGDSGETRYTVEKTGSGEVLTEAKGPGAPPFRVSKAIYDAVAQVLADSPEPLRFEDIMSEVAKKSAAAPGDFQIRVCLRYWMSLRPPLISRARKRYHPADRGVFLSTTKTAWKSLVVAGTP